MHSSLDPPEVLPLCSNCGEGVPVAIIDHIPMCDDCLGCIAEAPTAARRRRAALAHQQAD